MTSIAPVIADAGDCALVAAFEARIDPSINELAIILASRLRSVRLAGVRDIVPAFHTVTVYFDPLVVDRQALRSQLEAPVSLTGTKSSSGRHHDVTVQYDGEDLREVAMITGLSERQVVDVHAATEYRVFMSGFLPGFAYMGLLDSRIAVPRRSTPRMRVPAGSVAIAGGQTGIYPMDSPGGWHLIGRTAVRPYDPEREHPFLFSAGDTVRFVPE